MDRLPSFRSRVIQPCWIERRQWFVARPARRNEKRCVNELVARWTPLVDGEEHQIQVALREVAHGNNSKVFHQQDRGKERENIFNESFLVNFDHDEWRIIGRSVGRRRRRVAFVVSVR